MGCFTVCFFSSSLFFFKDYISLTQIWVKKSTVSFRRWGFRWLFFFGSVDFKGLLIVTKEMDPERIQIRKLRLCYIWMKNRTSWYKLFIKMLNISFTFDFNWVFLYRTNVVLWWSNFHLRSISYPSVGSSVCRGICWPSIGIHFPEYLYCEPCISQIIQISL